MAFTEPISQYFRTEDFGVEASFIVGATTYLVKGIFENIYSEDLSASGSIPTFTCATADVANLVKDAVITIESINYYLRVPKPDGTGVSTLVLEKVI